MTESVTDAFEDAEIAREEGGDREALEAILNSPEVWDEGYEFPTMLGVAVDAILAAGFTRQSPASTTAADAWDEGHDAGWNNGLDTTGNRHDRRVNPYRVAAPEGDGGNE